MRHLIVAATIFALAGCANHPMDCALGIEHRDCLPGTAGHDARAERLAQDRATCVEYGFQEGSDSYAQCRMILDQQFGARREAAMRQFIASQQRQTVTPTPLPQTTTVDCTIDQVYDQAQMRCVTRTN
jgi:hypothetical protein